MSLKLTRHSEIVIPWGTVEYSHLIFLLFLFLIVSPFFFNNLLEYFRIKQIPFLHCCILQASLVVLPPINSLKIEFSNLYPCIQQALLAVLPPINSLKILFSNLYPCIQQALLAVLPLSERHWCPGSQNNRQNCSNKCHHSYDCQQLFTEFLLRCLAYQCCTSHTDSSNSKCNSQRFPQPR